MSNLLAVAQATEALRGLLERSLQPDLSYPIKVEAGKPPSDPPVDATITVFCYQVTPNGSLRSADAPTRDASGAVIATPRAAYNLHFLISCYGPEIDLVPQALLGGVVRTLYEQPMLSQHDLESAAAARPSLAGADLAASDQRVRLTPIKLDVDDLSKLWSMMINTPFAPSVAYEATLVFLDGKATPAAGLPVLKSQLRVVAGQRPQIEQLLHRPLGSTDPPSEGPVPLGHEVILEGRNFLGDTTTVNVADRVISPSTIEDSRLVFAPPNDLPAGVLAVRVIRQIAFDATTRPLDSPVHAMARQPSIVATAVDATGMVTVQADLAIGDRQRVSLLLDQLDAAGQPRTYRFVAATPLPGPRNPDTVRIQTQNVVPATYLARIEVDGVQSATGSDLRTPALTF
jgi:hypothetical protein